MLQPAHGGGVEECLHCRLQRDQGPTHRKDCRELPAGIGSNISREGVSGGEQEGALGDGEEGLIQILSLLKNSQEISSPDHEPQREDLPPSRLRDSLATFDPSSEGILEEALSDQAPETVPATSDGVESSCLQQLLLSANLLPSQVFLALQFLQFLRFHRLHGGRSGSGFISEAYLNFFWQRRGSRRREHRSRCGLKARVGSVGKIRSLSRGRLGALECEE